MCYSLFSFAGIPNTFLLDSMDLMTTAPAPTITLLPICTPEIILPPIATRDASPIMALAPILADAEMSDSSYRDVTSKLVTRKRKKTPNRQ